MKYPITLDNTTIKFSLSLNNSNKIDPLLDKVYAKENETSFWFWFMLGKSEGAKI